MKPLDDAGVLLASLSLKEKLDVCRRVSTAAVGRLRTLARATDPDDLALLGLFERLARAEEGRLAEIEEVDARSDDGPSPPEARPDLLRGLFPSLSNLPGDSFIGREAGTYWAECLADESARLYGALADQSADEDSRAFFLRWEEENRLALAFLRKVLL